MVLYVMYTNFMTGCINKWYHWDWHYVMQKAFSNTLIILNISNKADVKDNFAVGSLKHSYSIENCCSIYKLITYYTLYSVDYYY